MWTGLWILGDVLFVAFLLMHLFARRSRQMLQWSGVSPDHAQMRKAAGRIRLYRALWIVSFCLMILALIFALRTH